MEVCDITWCCHVVSRGVTWCHMVSHGVTWCHMVSRGVTWCHVGPRDVTWGHGSHVGSCGEVSRGPRGLTWCDVVRYHVGSRGVVGSHDFNFLADHFSKFSNRVSTLTKLCHLNLPRKNGKILINF